MSETRVYVPEGNLYTYPDASVACGEQVYADEVCDTLANPVLVCEVSSSSTEAYHRGVKFEIYQSIPSLRQYVLIAQNRVRVDVFSRESRGGWHLDTTSSLDDVVELASIGCSLSVSELYRRASHNN